MWRCCKLLKLCSIQLHVSVRINNQHCPELVPAVCSLVLFHRYSCPGDHFECQWPMCRRGFPCYTNGIQIPPTPILNTNADQWVSNAFQVSLYVRYLAYIGFFLVKTSFCGEWNLEFGSNTTEKFEISRGEAE